MSTLPKKMVMAVTAALTFGAAGATGYALASGGSPSTVNGHLSDASVAPSPSPSPAQTASADPAPVPAPAAAPSTAPIATTVSPKASPKVVSPTPKAAPVATQPNTTSEPNGTVHPAPAGTVNPDGTPLVPSAPPMAQMSQAVPNKG